MQAFDNCPHNNGDKKGCPYYYESFGKCFSHCDLKSNRKCGDCAHWIGNCTSDISKRHSLYGHCFYCMGGVCSDFKTNCPHYTKRKDGEPNYIDWIEARVIELGGNPEPSLRTRRLRQQAREEWVKLHS